MDAGDRLARPPVGDDAGEALGSVVERVKPIFDSAVY
jgi:hypothetical protein